MRVAKKPPIPPAIAQVPTKPRWHWPSWRSLKLIFWLLILTSLASLVLVFRTIPKRFNILVIGSDQRSEERGRSDVLLVISLTKSPRDPMSIITIPRDTRVEVPGFGAQKATHAYALGLPESTETSLGNRELTEQTIESFLGRPIDATVEVTFKSFEQIIDDLGGVVTQAHGTLNGEEALKIVRDRSREGGDFARTADQREIVLQVLRRIRTENRWQAVYDFLQNSADSRIVLPKTRFALFVAYAVVRRGGQLTLTGAHSDVIPGRGSMLYTPEFGQDLYYWVPDATATSKLVDEWLS